MEKITNILVALGAVLFLFFLVQALRTKSPVKLAIISMLGGISALVAVNILGLPVAVNFVTAALSLTLGLPGVLLMITVVYIV